MSSISQASTFQQKIIAQSISDHLQSLITMIEDRMSKNIPFPQPFTNVTNIQTVVTRLMEIQYYLSVSIENGVNIQGNQQLAESWIAWTYQVLRLQPIAFSSQVLQLPAHEEIPLMISDVTAMEK